jgi:hypothetical protein
MNAQAKTGRSKIDKNLNIYRNMLTRNRLTPKKESMDAYLQFLHPLGISIVQMKNIPHLRGLESKRPSVLQCRFDLRRLAHGPRCTNHSSIVSLRRQ